MFNGLKKVCIKDYKNTGNAAVRVCYGIVAGVFGIISNLVLFAAKIAIGLISGSITVVADAVNNLSDAGSSVITLFGFRMASKPADKEHPFGHARFEYVSGLFVAFLVLAIGVILGKSSIEKIITPEEVNVTWVTYAVLGSAIVVKFIQMLLYVDFGKSIDSEALKAGGMDSRNDIVSTTAVLVASVVMQVFAVNIDGYMGIAVSLFILISGIKLIKETIDPLLGSMPSEKWVATVKEKLLSYEGVLGMHDLVMHSYGATQLYVLVHVEVDAKEDALKSHDLVDNIEHDFMKDLGIHLSIHTDPIVRDDPKLNRLKERVGEVLSALSSELSFHDFRMVEGPTHTNLLFDVVVPFDVDVKREEVQSALTEAFSGEETKYFFVFEIDRSYVL